MAGSGVVRVSEPNPIVRRVGLLVALFAWVLLLRAPMFLRSAVDWDESIYVLVASQWLHGHPPYTTVFDHKPVGIYAIFRVAFGLFGESIFSIRLMTTVFVFLTSIALFLLGRQLLSNTMGAVLAAVCYPVFTLGFQGTASNTELFFICFSVFGLHFLLKAASGFEHRNWLYGLAAGLSFGAAFQTKYLVALEIAYFVVYVLITHYRSLRERPGVLVMLACGATLPSALAVGYFWTNDILQQFVYANVETNRRYLSIGSAADVWRGFSHSLQDWIKWTWVTMVCAAWAASQRGRPPSQRTVNWFLGGWLLFGFLESWFTLRFFNHYYLVTLPPLILLFANLLAGYRLEIGSRRAFVLIMAFVLGFPIVRTIEKYYLSWVGSYVTDGDVNANIARHIRRRIRPEDYIYVVNGHPIIYFLAGVKLPTRYVLPPMILSPGMSHMAGVEYPAEVDRILSKEPCFVLVRDEREKNQRLSEIIERVTERYVVDARIDDTTIYLRRNLNSTR